MTRRPPVCPTCHRPYPPRLQVTGAVRQRLVDIVGDRLDGVTRAELMNLVYADRIDGGPDTPQTISVLIHLANRQLASQGWEIKAAWRGHGARYHLVQIDPSTTEDSP